VDLKPGQKICNTQKREKRKGRKDKKSNSVRERMIHNKKYPKDKKIMGTHCQQKINGDTLPIQNIWGHIVNKKYMGGHIANTKY
jgi:hypothetical protein